MRTLAPSRDSFIHPFIHLRVCVRVFVICFFRISICRANEACPRLSICCNALSERPCGSLSRSPGKHRCFSDFRFGEGRGEGRKTCEKKAMGLPNCGECQCQA